MYDTEQFYKWIYLKSNNQVFLQLSSENILHIWEEIKHMFVFSSSNKSKAFISPTVSYSSILGLWIL